MGDRIKPIHLVSIGLLGVGAVAFLLMQTDAIKEALFARQGQAQGGGGEGGGGGGGDRDRGRTETYEIEVEDVKPKPPKYDDLLEDDQLQHKNPVFDPSLVFPEPAGDWRVNLSAAVFRLDAPLLRPDHDGALLQLRPSYAEAAKASTNLGKLLPSINAIDGKAKQFDDGLYAALDLAYYSGLDAKLKSHVDLFARLFEQVGPSSPAAPFLAAGLEIAGRTAAVDDEAAKSKWKQMFLGNEVWSKPIGFYTWNNELKQCFQVLRYFQQWLEPDDPILPELVKAVESNEGLKQDLSAAVKFYGKLTKPMSIPSVVELAGKPNSEWPKGRVALLPASTSREHELFKRLFPEGLPPDADLMREFVTKIRSGAIDLSPRPDSGWYDWQINALETFLLPEKGAESEKLQLMKTYKKRMLEAFEALVTKRRETHVRQLDMPKEATMAMRPLDEYMPALRLEPNPTYYLRTARGYGFLLSFLETAVGSGELAKLHGLKQGGVREPSLHEELMSMRDLFYGLYLVSCEDLGIRPEAEVSAGVKDPAACHTTAQTWLSKIWDDPDLAIDTRVAVPVFQDGERNVTRVWATLGVRLARLQVDFAKPPSVKPLQGEGDWKPLERYQMQGQSYVIPVDEFAEIELRGNRVLTRDELRALCDRLKTKEAIVSGISGQ